MKNKKFISLINHFKKVGFFFQNSEIYGGLSNTWDLGFLGIELKKNLIDLWWKDFIISNIYNFGFQSSIFMNSKVWKTSGHVDIFNDYFVDCYNCKSRFRIDKIIVNKKIINKINYNIEKINYYIKKKKILCKKCKLSNFTKIKKFNLMFKTIYGATKKKKIYLRPETAQGIFVNFKNILRVIKKKIPFGIGQIGKVFRNEVTLEHFIFKTREFEQMELEFFIKPGQNKIWFNYWKKFILIWLKKIGIKNKNLRIKKHNKEELSHYSTKTHDIEYNYPWGYSELWGISDREDYDLKLHQKFTKNNLEYYDSKEKIKYLPHCIEPSVSVERLMLAILCESYYEEKIKNGNNRKILKFSPFIAPIKIAIFPLSKKLNKIAKKIYNKLITKYSCIYDENGSIGKRYRKQDEIGTPFCLTIDFNYIKDKKITLRFRDTMKQIRFNIFQLEVFLKKQNL